MEVFEKNKGFKIINGDSLKVLDTIPENSIDAIITDPPYELGFMGKSWDRSGIAYNLDLWRKALKVLKPGGFLLAFGGTRTYHRIACAIEDAGFEIRDTIMWLYGSGFPKSMNIGLAIDKKNGVESEVIGKNRGGSTSRAYQSEKFTTAGVFDVKRATNEWAGWGTALKPAYEPIIVARKPCEKSVIENVQKYRVGGINIDECRVETKEKIETGRNGRNVKSTFSASELHDAEREYQENGRFPANVILTYDETDEKEVCGGMPNSNGSQGKPFSATDYKEKETATNFTRGDFNPYNDEGSAARYFYCAKASKKDRDSGLIEFESKAMFVADNEHGNLGAFYVKKAGGKIGDEQLRKNIHPTVKPVELMEYLIRLVCPKGATILDIFNGSGSTGKAVAFENRERDANYKYIGIELDKEYCRISESRIDYALNQYKYDIMEEIKENKDKGQLSLFDYNNEEEGD